MDDIAWIFAKLKDKNSIYHLLLLSITLIYIIIKGMIEHFQVSLSPLTIYHTIPTLNDPFQEGFM